MSTNFFLLDKLAEDVLQVVSDDEVSNILELLKSDEPHSITACTFIRSRSEWQKKDPTEKFYVLCPNGSWKNGTVVAVATTDLHVVVYTLEENCHELKTALMNTKIINWGKRKLAFPYIHEKHSGVLIEILQHKVLWSSTTIVRDMFYTLSAEKVERMEITPPPPGMYIAQLEPHHTQTVYDAWNYAEFFSPEYVERILRFCKIFGIFSENKNELLCFAGGTDYGIGLLTTLESHRRKGYADILLRYLINELSKLGESTAIHIKQGNKQSESLFTRLGYEPVCNIDEIFCNLNGSNK